MRSVIIKVSPNGETNIEAVGFTDNTSCVKATEWLEKALGKPIRREKKNEIQQKQEVKQQ
jgi:hypothetical protein